MNRALDRIKAFGMTNQMLVDDLSRIEATFDVELAHIPRATPSVEPVYYPQIDASVRKEAAEMARHYEVFYSLEKTIRNMVAEALETAAATQPWWDSGLVPPAIKQEVSGRIQKELDAGVTRRSFDELDYTTFGELLGIITFNWDTFGAIFNTRKGLEKVMVSLNALRNPIAHCCPLAEDEQLRLQLTVRDWFRMME